jgi:phosphinothricin acetyltransferase
LELRLARIDDAEAIRVIYNNEVASGTATFDLTPRTLEQQRDWLTERSGAHMVLVAEVDRTIIGFGALSRYMQRPAYSTTVEDSVYVRPENQGQGVGEAILASLIDRAAEHGFHTIIARIGSESEGSIALHRKAGFKDVGKEREIGRKFGRWLDVVIMQRFVLRQEN